MKPLLISEIFGPTIQGEGALIGKPTVFVRTGGCDFRCSWCDTLYAVLPEYKSDWTRWEPQAIVDRVLALSGGKRILVTLSGGNPALQPCAPLLELGRRSGLTFALETQGSKPKAWFAELDHLTLSPKGPSSQMTTDWDALQQCVAAAGEATSVSLKVVIFDDGDYNFAREAALRLPELPVYLQVGSDLPCDDDAARTRTEWLLQRVAHDGWFTTTILPQLHVLLWGNRRGV